MPKQPGQPPELQLSDPFRGIHITTVIKHDTYHLPESTLEGLDDAERRSLQDTWALCGSVEPAVDAGTKDAIRSIVMTHVKATLTSESTPLRPVRIDRPVARIHSMRMRMVSIAAALVVGISMFLSSPGQHYRADHGTVAQEITLDDGSTILLAAGSRLSVPDGFGIDDRTVILHGEAFFDVAEGPAPFAVRTADSRTTVLGTSFNVRSWPGSLSPATEIIVTSGRVSVSAQAHQSIVEPGQSLTASPAALIPVETNPDLRLAWMQGGFSYDNELIGTVLEDVERRFDIRVKAPASIRLRPITIHRNHVGEASEFLGDIAATISVRYRQTANGFELYLD